MQTRTCGWLAAVSFALLAGCATDATPPPRAEVARAELAITQAERADAPQYAPVALNEARNQMRQARSAMDAERYAEARRLAEQAQANAQLALAEAEAGRAEKLAGENLKNVETLREELRREQQISRGLEPGVEGRQ